MENPTSTLTWDGLSDSLARLYSLPHNLFEREKHARERGTASRSVATEVEAKIREIRQGSIGVPQPVEFIGPKRFLRAVGPGNRAYRGEWWFAEELLAGLEQKVSRIYFGRDRSQVIRDILREVLAVSREWNPFDEVWALEIPPGARLTGLVSRTATQPLFATRPLDAAGNRLLMGREEQVYFPVKDPLWVHLYCRLR